MKTAHEILLEIWRALDRKADEAASGLSTPNEIFAEFTQELSLLEASLRYPENLQQLTSLDVHVNIRKFVSASRRAASKQTTDLVQMHRIARDIFFDLGLTSILTDAKIFFPKRTRHLYLILVALDLRIEKCSSGVTTLHPSILRFYDEIAKEFHNLLDSALHIKITDDVEQALTQGFIDAVAEAAHDGKKGELHRKNVRLIFQHLGLSELFPKFSDRFPERSKSGFFIVARGRASA